MASRFVIENDQTLPGDVADFPTVFDAVAHFDTTVDADGMAELVNGRVRVTEAGYYLVDALLLVVSGYHATAS